MDPWQSGAWHGRIYYVTKFTAEMSEKEATFLETIIYKGARFNGQSILDVRAHLKPPETFQYRPYS